MTKKISWKNNLNNNNPTDTIRFSGRSSDFIAPSFAYGCLYNCTYCYMKRHMEEGLIINTGVDQILSVIDTHCKNVIVDNTIKKPNQTDKQYITYDISCNEDFALHHKYHNWKYIFNWFKLHTTAKATFATKYICKEFLEFNPENKVRIRFSLMPQKIADILEPNTSRIIDRIIAINTFIEAGYDVHINYSPVIIYQNWLQDYFELFNLVNTLVKDIHKHRVLAEVIFLTHNKNKHIYNIDNKLPGENLLWNPHLQEPKVSLLGGGNNVRYNRKLKPTAIQEFKELHSKVIKWNTIRYIF
jgi:spore photoproduct lyase